MKEVWKAWAGSLVRAVIAALFGCNALFAPPLTTFNYEGSRQAWQWLAIAAFGFAVFYGVRAVFGYIRWREMPRAGSG